jgi:sugar phosphate permease
MATMTAGRARPHTNLRWWIALLLGFGILINYFDRVNLSVAHPDITKDFGINDVQFGYLLSGFRRRRLAGRLLDRSRLRTDARTKILHRSRNAVGTCRCRRRDDQ